MTVQKSERKVKNASMQFFNRENVKEDDAAYGIDALSAPMSHSFLKQSIATDRHFDAVDDLIATKRDAIQREFAFNSKQRQRFRLIVDSALN